MKNLGNNKMNFNKHKLLLAGLVTLHLLFNATVAQAALVNLVSNGSFNDPVTNSNSATNNNITDWSIMNSVFGSNASQTPDINNVDNNVGYSTSSDPFTAQNVTTSTDGGNWVGLGISNTSNGAKLQDEGIKQVINFASAGTYLLEWEEGNFGYGDPNSTIDFNTIGFNGSNKIRATIGNLNDNGQGFKLNQSQSFSSDNFITVSNTWYSRAFSFEVTQAGTQTLQFSLDSIQSRAYLSLDGVSITAVSAVPEPESWAMMFAGLMLLGFQARKRTLNS